MQIQAYQFIKYNENTTIEHIEKVYNTGAVICFDFEDGILNPLEMEKTSSLKEKARMQFNTLYSLIYNFSKDIKVGIRLNNVRTSDFEKDLIKIKGKTFDSIFTPKIEQSEDIQLMAGKLNEFKIEYKNLIPIIESKKGFENLENILQSNQILSKIAFGHCDYNLDIDTYPFFHQNSWEYWKWINEIIAKIEKKGIQLINSPYLNTDDETFFCSMLDYLSRKNNHFYGQVTLSTRQSILCNSRNSAGKNFTEKLENKNKISADKKLALELVNEFEANNKLKGLSKSNNKFISLQEYLASKKLIHDTRFIHEMCFIGGCFPVQHNVVFEDLFHQKLRRKIEESFKNKLNVNIIRYERFSTVLDKIKTLVDSKKLDLIVFHVRPEPYLRLIKLFYKYIDNKGRLKRSLNLPYFNLLNPEKYDILDIRSIFHINVKQRKSVFHNFLISCNYIFGSMIGNKHYALKSYYQTTNGIIDFCNSHNIKYVILGPNRRNNNHLEPSLCMDLDLYFSDRIDNRIYICGYTKDMIRKMNQENGIHVTQDYHDLIAEKLYKTIVDNKLLSPTKCICHKGFSGYSSIIARSNLRFGGQETASLSHTANTLVR
jgi:citrate lyase beta subunit